MITSAYIHIPFCNTICSYCDFPKIYYNNCFIDKYLDNLESEIKVIYKNDILDTLYIGGGTPSSLNIEELKKLFNILKIFKLNKNYEFTIECNLDSLTKEKLDLFKKNGVNRISIGIESFNKNNLKLLNRKLVNLDLIEYSKKIGIDNINIDLIYALPNQTLEELNEDLDLFLALDIKHISTYSLIIEDNTLLKINGVQNIDDELDLEMYKLIIDKLKNNGFNHYEISNFAKEGYESKHNLTYWNNFEYYGFGMGASSYINNKRINNTKSITKYLNGIYKYDEEELDKKKKMEYEMILGLRKIEGVNIKEFYNKYQINIEDVFDIKDLLEKGKLIKENGFIRINEDYLYLSNDILINFIGEE